MIYSRRIVFGYQYITPFLVKLTRVCRKKQVLSMNRIKRELHGPCNVITMGAAQQCKMQDGNTHRLS